MSFRTRFLSFLGSVDFESICGQGRGVADYIELAKEFHTLMISGVPKLGVHNDSEARRFIHLIDVLYEARTKVIIGSVVAIDELYTGDRVGFEFDRTVSRLIEMQSDEYLCSAHLMS